MTIFKDINDQKLYTIRTGTTGNYSKEIFVMVPYNHIGQTKEITNLYFDKYIVPVGER